MYLQIAPVRQNVSTQQVKNVSEAVREGLYSLPLKDRISPGMRVAIALGSRGISCIQEVVKTLIDELKIIGAHPFCVPAMGSHGGGDAAGQQAVLEGYGLTETFLEAPIISSMEVIEVGVTKEGMPVYFSADAAKADAIVVVNRIKEHTAFKAPYESGLLKILAVGLGKARGAAEIHNWGIAAGLHSAGQYILDNMPISFGIGIMENGRHAPAHIAVLPAERILVEEPGLLDKARGLAPKIPFEPLDLVVLQEIGKDISGTGMDLNVVGMWRRTGGPVQPAINVIGALDLTQKSYGNAIGIGHADMITRRLLERVDLQTTYINCLTSKNLAGAKIPLTLETDRDLFEAALRGIQPACARVVIIRNTLELEYMWVSSSLLKEVDEHPTLVQLADPRVIEFDEQGNLTLATLEGSNVEANSLR